MDTPIQRIEINEPEIGRIELSDYCKPAICVPKAIAQKKPLQYQCVVCHPSKFSISLGKSYFVTIDWIPVPALDSDPGFAGMKGT